MQIEDFVFLIVVLTVYRTCSTPILILIFVGNHLLNDEMNFDIIKIGSLERNKVRFLLIIQHQFPVSTKD
jgi:hypothetical protein